MAFRTHCVRALVTVVAVSTALAACTARSTEPDLGALYDRVAMESAYERNPVIVIPGILGTRLVDEETDRVIWGAFAGDYADPGTEDGARLVALPMREGAPLAELRDGGYTDGVLDHLEVSILGLPVTLRAYVDILRSLGVGGYRDQLLGEAGSIDYGPGHFTCFQFPYDWRRDNVENARLLHEYILSRKAYVKKALAVRLGREVPDVKFDIVAHSMGGLLARYYLRYGPNEPPAPGANVDVPWTGAENVERLVIVGTPSAGSSQAILDMVNGVRFPFPLPSYEPAILGTMPSVYQLLPRTRHQVLSDPTVPKGESRDLLELATWVNLGWGLAAPDQDGVLEELLPDVTDAGKRRRIALDHLRKCLDRARAFQHALDVPADPPAGTSLYLMAGDAEPTPHRVKVDSTDGSVELLEIAPGDGTVTRASALMDERLDGDWAPQLRSPIRWSQVVFLFSDHLGMTRDPAFVDNILYLLLEDPRR